MQAERKSKMGGTTSKNSLLWLVDQIEENNLRKKTNRLFLFKISSHYGLKNI